MKALIIIDTFRSDPEEKIMDIIDEGQEVTLESLRESWAENLLLKRVLKSLKKKFKDFEYRIVDFDRQPFWAKVREKRLDPSKRSKQGEWNREYEAGEILKNSFKNYDCVFCTSLDTYEFMELFTSEHKDVVIDKLPNEYYSRARDSFEEDAEKIITEKIFSNNKKNCLTLA